MFSIFVDLCHFVTPDCLKDEVIRNWETLVENLYEGQVFRTYQGQRECYC